MWSLICRQSSANKHQAIDPRNANAAWLNVIHRGSCWICSVTVELYMYLGTDCGNKPGSFPDWPTSRSASRRIQHTSCFNYRKGGQSDQSCSGDRERRCGFRWPKHKYDGPWSQVVAGSFPPSSVEEHILTRSHTRHKPWNIANSTHLSKYRTKCFQKLFYSA